MNISWWWKGVVTSMECVYYMEIASSHLCTIGLALIRWLINWNWNSFEMRWTEHIIYIYKVCPTLVYAKEDLSSRPLYTSVYNFKMFARVSTFVYSIFEIGTHYGWLKIFYCEGLFYTTIPIDETCHMIMRIEKRLSDLGIKIKKARLMFRCCKTNTIIIHIRTI